VKKNYNSIFRNLITFPLLMTLVLLGAGCFSETKDSRETGRLWSKISPGIWRIQAGPENGPSLLTESGSIPRMQSLALLPDTSFPVKESEISVRIEKGRTYIRFPLVDEEQLFGLGLNFKNVNQRGRIFRLHVDHYGGRDNGRTHAPVPFILSSTGYGILIDTANYIDVYAGTGVTAESSNPAVPRDRNTDKNWTASPRSDNLEIVIPGEGVRMAIFAGTSMMDAVRRFNLFCGGGFIPPKWGLGFWQRTPTLFSAEDVSTEVSEFSKKDFPLDVIGLEPGWHSKSYPCTFAWDSGRFPAPEEFINQMEKEGIKINLWMNPYLSPDSPVYEKMRPYTGSHTVWNGRVPDYTMPEAAKIMKDYLKKELTDIGVSGFKVDEIDGFDHWLWPDTAEFPSGRSGEQMRQTYGLRMLRIIDETYRKAGRRTYGLTRASNAGGVRFPYVIYNDYYSHPDFITALINSGFNGILWTPEVRSGGSAEDWLRRMQTVCFSPLAMINAWADGTKPWSYPEVYKQCREAALLRMRLLPYMYSVFAGYYFEGTPPFYGLNLLEDFYQGPEAGNPEEKTAKAETRLDSTQNPYAEASRMEIKDQYMFGPSIMVPPLFAGETERNIFLPHGNWYDFYTGEYAGNSETIRVKPGLDKIPVYVRDGAIIPMLKHPVRQTSEWKDVPLEIRVYGQAEGDFRLYDDDGETYDYEEGEYSVNNLFTKKDKDGALSGFAEEKESSGPWAYSEITWKFMTENIPARK
jgi:alpha-glucosidase (family GH31 glycosyl hydrolase)